MTMHIYAFGSLCRGEIDLNSDVDLLAIVDARNDALDTGTFSVYSYNRIKELWNEGNPFAWHLYLEAKLIFTNDGRNFLSDIGAPKEYVNTLTDCIKFYQVFNSARNSLMDSSDSAAFDLSSIFLSIRNFASCYSLGHLKRPIFSRSAALMLEAESIDIEKDVYEMLECNRILCTRGKGRTPSSVDIENALNTAIKIEQWMTTLLLKIKGNDNGRI